MRDGKPGEPAGHQDGLLTKFKIMYQSSATCIHFFWDAVEGLSSRRIIETSASEQRTVVVTYKTVPLFRMGMLHAVAVPLMVPVGERGRESCCQRRASIRWSKD